MGITDIPSRLAGVEQSRCSDLAWDVRNGILEVLRRQRDAVVGEPRVKAEPLERLSEVDRFPADLGCCDLCRPVRDASPPPHSDIARKREQRQTVVQMVADRCAPGTVVNVLLFDDFLAEDGLLTFQLLGRFGADRVRVFSPNVRPEVVQALRAATWWPAGCVVSGVGCYHAFLQHWQQYIHALGGFHVVSVWV